MSQQISVLQEWNFHGISKIYPTDMLSVSTPVYKFFLTNREELPSSCRCRSIFLA